jgi:hypothetical protein
MAEEIVGTPEAIEAPQFEGQPPVAEAPPEEVSAPDPKESLFALLKERPEYVDEYLETLSDEETSKYKALNRRVDKGITKARKDLEQKYSKEAEERTQSQQWMQQYRAWAANATPDEVLNASVQYASEIAKHTAILAKVAPANDAQALLARAEEGFRRTLKEAMPEIEDWDDVRSVDEIKERAQKAKERVKMEAREEEKKSWEERFKALEAQMNARRNADADQPDKNSGSGAAKGTRQYTVEEIARMPLAQYREHAAEIDKAVAEGRLK